MCSLSSWLARKPRAPYLDQAPLFGQVAFFGAQLKNKQAPSEAQNYHNTIFVFLFLSYF